MFGNSQSQEATRPKIGVVLSSGGIKPLAAIPLFDFLDEARVPIDLLVGCSGGSIMSALRGSGFDSEQALDFFRRLERDKVLNPVNFRSLLGLVGLPLGRFNMQSGLIRPKRIKQALQDTFGDRRIEDLYPKTLLQATDVETGQGVIMDKGPLAQAVYASCALFPVFPPIQFNGRRLADGYYTSPLPVVEAVKHGMDIIIAVIFADPINLAANSYMACLSNYYTIQGDACTRFQMALSIDLHHQEIIIIKVPFTRAINIWDSHEIPTIIDTGRRAIERSKEEILSAIASFTIP